MKYLLLLVAITLTIVTIYCLEEKVVDEGEIDEVAEISRVKRSPDPDPRGGSGGRGGKKEPETKKKKISTKPQVKDKGKVETKKETGLVDRTDNAGWKKKKSGAQSHFGQHIKKLLFTVITMELVVIYYMH
jgi:hypothetical protein